MKFTALRQYIKNKNLSSLHCLEKCELIIDGDSFFRNSYKHSNCQFVLGPDCDRYADFIINKLSLFIDNLVKCYVIFSGGTKHDIARRKAIHERIINDRDFARIDMAQYFEPLFISDVQKLVLDEMDIKYFVCEYDSLEAIVALGRKLKCPVLTNNIEYSCFGVSCIMPNSLYKHEGVLNCTIYKHKAVKDAIGVYDKMPILLALLNESSDYLEKLALRIENGDSNDIKMVIRYVKQKKEATVVHTVVESIEDEDQIKVFKEVYEKIKTIYLYPLCTLVLKYFQRDRAHGLFKDDKKWFAKGVSNGRIAVPYINLKRKSVITGSLLMNESNRPDALLAAIEIIAYSHCILKNSNHSTLYLIGREGKKSSVKEVKSFWDKDISNRDIFTKHRVGKKLKLLTKEPEVFEQFLNEVLSGYDYKNPLKTVPDECWILILTLVYYVLNKNKDFINGAYCILLSYIMLGPASRLVSKLKKINQSSSVSNTAKEAVAFYNGLEFLFKPVDLRRNYNSTIVHNLSEFQHCLQHMNYLNKLCGEKFPCTAYHDTYNATFIYNALLFMYNKNELLEYLEHRFAGSVCLKTYKTVVTGFENCMSVAKVFAKPYIFKSLVVKSVDDEVFNCMENDECPEEADQNERRNTKPKPNIRSTTNVDTLPVFCDFHTRSDADECLDAQ